MASEVDALVQSVRTRHALQVHAVDLSTSTEGEVVTDLSNPLEGEELVLQPCRLVQVVLVEQGTVGEVPWLGFDDAPSDHPLPGELEPDAPQRVAPDLLHFVDRLTVDAAEDRDVHQLFGVVVEQHVEGFAEFLEVSCGNLNVLDFEVVVHLEHQDLPNRVDALEHGQVPAAVQHGADLPDETRDVGVGLRQDAHRPVLSPSATEGPDFLRSAIEILGFWHQRSNAADASILFQRLEGDDQFFVGTADVEPKRVGLDGPDATDDLAQSVLEGQPVVDLVDAVVEGQTSTTSWNFFELFRDQKLALEVGEAILDVTLELLVFVAFRIHGHDFGALRFLAGQDAVEQVGLHRTDVRLGFESEQHGKVPARRVPLAVVQEPSVDDVTVQLQVLPIAEPEIVDPVEQFLLLLEEQVLVKGLVDVIVHGERLVEDHVLDGAVLDDLFFAARDAVLVDFEDELGLFGLREEADADDVSSLKLVDGPLDHRPWEGQPRLQVVSGLWAFRAEHLDELHAQGFLGVAQFHVRPRRDFCSAEGGGHAVGHPCGVQREEVFHVPSAVGGKAPEGAVDFAHVGAEPLAVEFLHAGCFDFRDPPCGAQFLDPTADDFVVNAAKFLSIEWISERSVEATTVFHERQQGVRVHRDWDFVGVIVADLLVGHLRGQGAPPEQALEDGRVDVLDEEGPRAHGHQVLERGHVQRHANAAGQGRPDVHNPCLSLAA